MTTSPWKHTPPKQADIEKITVLLKQKTAPLPEIFGDELAAVLENEANVRCIPVNSMVTIFIVVASVFMSNVTIGNKAYVMAIIFYFVNVGDTGINKTSITRYINYLVDKISRNLKVISRDHAYCRKNGIYVMEYRAGTNTCCGTIEALLKTLSNKPAAIENKDEADLLDRIIKRGENSLAIFQVRMQFFIPLFHLSFTSDSSSSHLGII